MTLHVTLLITPPHNPGSAPVITCADELMYALPQGEGGGGAC